jgi:hypothetical protein
MAANSGAGIILVVMLWMILFPGLRNLDRLSDLQFDGGRPPD